MYIRQTTTRSRTEDTSYTTFRLVQSVRVDGKVRQQTLLNLGRHFAIPREQWPELVQRAEALRSGGTELSFGEPEDPALERAAEEIAERLRARESAAVEASPKVDDIQEVRVDSLETCRCRSVGVEHVALWALEQLGLPELLNELSDHRTLNRVALASIVARMARPASERATHQWLRLRSAAGELLDLDFERQSPMQLYRASDLLMRHRERIESHLFDRAMSLLDLKPSIAFYDLTNTYFEGAAEKQDKAAFGHSKERRSDCRLLTLALVLDASGMVRRSRVYAGNQREDQTLRDMLEDLEAPREAVVVMDRGIATEEQLEWLRGQERNYVVMSRRRHRGFDPGQAEDIETRDPENRVRIQRAVSETDGEAFLYCHSEKRAKREEKMAQALCERFERELRRLHDGLSKPRTAKKAERVRERIGRLKERHRKISHHYDLELEVNDENRATALAWKKNPKPGSPLAIAGVSCLRTNLLDWNAQRLWDTYTRLTDVESAFRSLKTELGLRPVFHRRDTRAEGHLFISVLAYQAVQLIRTTLREAGIRDSWNSLRLQLESQNRLTVTFQRRDRRTLQVRKCSRPEPEQTRIYRALGIDSRPGGVQKSVTEPAVTGH